MGSGARSRRQGYRAGRSVVLVEKRRAGGNAHAGLDNLVVVGWPGYQTVQDDDRE